MGPKSAYMSSFYVRISTWRVSQFQVEFVCYLFSHTIFYRIIISQTYNHGNGQLITIHWCLVLDLIKVKYCIIFSDVFHPFVEEVSVHIASVKWGIEWTNQRLCWFDCGVIRRNKEGSQCGSILCCVCNHSVVRACELPVTDNLQPNREEFEDWFWKN